MAALRCRKRLRRVKFDGTDHLVTSGCRGIGLAAAAALSNEMDRSYQGRRADVRTTSSPGTKRRMGLVVLSTTLLRVISTTLFTIGWIGCE